MLITILLLRMKALQKVILIFFVSITFTSGLYAQQKYTAPALSDPDSWSMILLPDPQTYVKFERNQPIFELMTAWISENVDHLNVKLVLCTGDLVEENENINPNGKNTNQPSKAMWTAVSKAFDRLNNKVPYIAATGNHDFGYLAAENRNSNFNTYFPVDKNPLNQKLLRDVTTDIDGVPTLANATFEMTSPKGKKYLVLNLEFAPRDTVISWAKKVIAQPVYKDHTIIVLTHSYLNAENEHIQKEKYLIKDVNYGAAMFSKLIQPSKIFRWFCQAISVRRITTRRISLSGLIKMLPARAYSK